LPRVDGATHCGIRRKVSKCPNLSAARANGPIIRVIIPNGDAARFGINVLNGIVVIAGERDALNAKRENPTVSVIYDLATAWLGFGRYASKRL
jgi:hypothetical protein